MGRDDFDFAGGGEFGFGVPAAASGGDFEAVALFGAVEVVGHGVVVEFLVVEGDVARLFVDCRDGVDFGIEPGAVVEDGGVAFYDDAFAGAQGEVGPAVFVGDDCVLEVIDVGFARCTSTFLCFGGHDGGDGAVGRGAGVVIGDVFVRDVFGRVLIFCRLGIVGIVRVEVVQCIVQGVRVFHIDSISCWWGRIHCLGREMRGWVVVYWNHGNSNVPDQRWIVGHEVVCFDRGLWIVVCDDGNFWVSDDRVVVVEARSVVEL